LLGRLFTATIPFSPVVHQQTLSPPFPLLQTANLSPSGLKKRYMSPFGSWTGASPYSFSFFFFFEQKKLSTSLFFHWDHGPSAEIFRFFPLWSQDASLSSSPPSSSSTTASRPETKKNKRNRSPLHDDRFGFATLFFPPPPTIIRRIFFFFSSPDFFQPFPLFPPHRRTRNPPLPLFFFLMSEPYLASFLARLVQAALRRIRRSRFLPSWVVSASVFPQHFTEASPFFFVHNFRQVDFPFSSFILPFPFPLFYFWSLSTLFFSVERQARRPNPPGLCAALHLFFPPFSKKLALGHVFFALSSDPILLLPFLFRPSRE